MIAVDTSTLVCLYLEELGYERAVAAIEVAGSAAICTTTYVEFAMLARIGGERIAWLEQMLVSRYLQLEPFTAEMARLSADAAIRYGKGSGHPAQLNFGDCLSYAFAKSRNIPLLFVGADFAHTDVQPAL